MPNSQNTTVNLANRRANIVVEAGERIECIFTSTELGTTAGEATVAGRVVNPDGRGVKGVTVSITDAADGTTRYAITNSFGYYSFDQLTVGNYFLLKIVRGKRYTILDGERSFTLQDDLLTVDMLVDR